MKQSTSNSPTMDKSLVNAYSLSKSSCSPGKPSTDKTSAVALSLANSSKQIAK